MNDDKNPKILYQKAVFARGSLLIRQRVAVKSKKPAKGIVLSPYLGPCNRNTAQMMTDRKVESIAIEMHMKCVLDSSVGELEERYLHG